MKDIGSQLQAIAGAEAFMKTHFILFSPSSKYSGGASGNASSFAPHPRVDVLGTSRVASQMYWCISYVL